MRTIDLPAGAALLIERVDQAGTPHARRIAAYAISTPAGMASLVIDGPPASWTTREADLARIPSLMRFAPVRNPPVAPGG